jgi:hypothetical protein
VALAGWINQQQQEVIEYLRTDNQVLKETQGKKRVLLKRRSASTPGSEGEGLGA